MNIFSHEFFLSELEAYNSRWSGEPSEFGSTRISVGRFPGGRLDNYMAVNFSLEEFDLVRLTRNGTMWMSLTPMEIQSNWVAIQRAKHYNKIALAGLGLGYVPIRILDTHPDVEWVDIYEEQPEIIELFKQNFGHHPDFYKIKFIQGRVQDKMLSKYYPYVYVDIYPNQADDDIPLDMGTLTEQNEIGEYRYWTQEMSVATADPSAATVRELQRLEIWTPEDAQLLSMFYESDASNLKGYMHDQDWARDTIETHIESMTTEEEKDLAYDY